MQAEFIAEFERYSENYWQKQSRKLPDAQVLWDSLKYSFASGGKRFRPYLVSLVVSAYNKKTTYLPYALAIEMIHTYSLIHDDLPCMDNDDFRRGKPTNHKVYGEDIALLAGDALLTQAFSIVASEFADQPQLAVQLMQILSIKAGAIGMIGGQVLDMKSQSKMAIEQLELMHRLKTGALIEAAVLGATHIAQSSAGEHQAFAQFAKAVGLAFQIKDDILDANDKAQDFKSFISVLGIEKTQEELEKQSQLALQALSELSHLNVQPLKDLVSYNQDRNL